MVETELEAAGHTTHSQEVERDENCRSVLLLFFCFEWIRDQKMNALAPGITFIPRREKQGRQGTRSSTGHLESQPSPETEDLHVLPKSSLQLL